MNVNPRRMIQRTLIWTHSVIVDLRSPGGIFFWWATKAHEGLF